MGKMLGIPGLSSCDVGGGPPPRIGTLQREVIPYRYRREDVAWDDRMSRVRVEHFPGGVIRLTCGAIARRIPQLRLSTLRPARDSSNVLCCIATIRLIPAEERW